MAYGVLIESMIQAKNIDALNRSVKAQIDVAGGGLIAIILSACNVPWVITMPVFIVVSLALLICFRKIVMKYLNKGDARTNADSAIGKEYALLTPIEFNTPGTIKINDVVWNVTTEAQGETIAQGTIVRVLSLKGNKYIVEKV